MWMVDIVNGLPAVPGPGRGLTVDEAIDRLVRVAERALCQMTEHGRVPPRPLARRASNEDAMGPAVKRGGPAVTRGDFGCSSLPHVLVEHHRQQQREWVCVDELIGFRVTGDGEICMEGVQSGQLKSVGDSSMITAERRWSVAYWLTHSKMRLRGTGCSRTSCAQATSRSPSAPEVSPNVTSGREDQGSASSRQRSALYARGAGSPASVGRTWCSVAVTIRVRPTALGTPRR